MAIADDRKILTDNDITAVVSGVRTGAASAAASIRSTRRPPCTIALHESGYGHGV